MAERTCACSTAFTANLDAAVKPASTTRSPRLLTVSQSTSPAALRSDKGSAGLRRGSYLSKVLCVVRVELGGGSLGHW